MTAAPSVAVSPVSRSAALLVGFEQPLRDALRAELEPLVSISIAANAAEALALLKNGAFDLLCVGAGVNSHNVRELVSASDRTGNRVHLVLSAGGAVDSFQNLVDDARLFYLSRDVPAAADIARLMRSALQHRRASDDESAHQVVAICEHARYLADEHDPRRLSLAAAQIVEETIRADRARCLFHDHLSESLLRWTAQDSKPSAESAAVGIASFVARTGAVVRANRVGDDPRYNAEADNEGGSGSERFLAVPVGLPTLSGDDPPRVSAVLIAIRNPHAEPFSDHDAALLQLFADRLAPSFDEVAAHAEDPGAVDGNIFRREALHHLQRSEEELGRPMNFSPRWTRWAYPVIVLAAVAAFAYAWFGTIAQYARGFAVVRMARGEPPEVVAYFPARYAPQLEVGMPLRLRIDGHGWPGERLKIGRISEIVGRMYGSTQATDSTIPLTGSVVVVRCPLTSDRFSSGSQTYPYRNGLPGSAEVTLRSDRIVYSLMPALRSLGAKER
jgi:hypothetical protein